MIWLIPAAVAAVAAVPVLLALRRVALEAVALRREVAAFVALGEPILELRAAATAVAGRVPGLQLRTRPRAISAP